MPVSAAYLAVVLIWSTTPLGIVWSSESVSPTMAVLLRMVIAAIIGVIVIWFNKRIALPWHRRAKLLYCYSAIGIFGGMLLSYFASQYISSGMISLVFGLAPILSGLLAQKILSEPAFGFVRRVAIIIAVLGLCLVCSENVAFGNEAYIGLLLVLGAVFFFSLSGVLVKSVHITIHPIATTVGSLIVCIPFFALTWYFFDGTLLIETWEPRSLWAILYLGIFGSLVGFVAYFFVLQKLNASTVSLITMITPILAICLGALLNDELLSINIVLGALTVMFGLWIYQFGPKLIQKRKLRVTQEL